VSGLQPASPQRFQTTRWSLVREAGTPAGCQSALSELCEAYWYPLYAFARRSGEREADAQDLVQGFFAVLIEKGYLGDADRERGRFRTFLLASYKNHASKERAKARAQKRGGDRLRFSLDFEDGERRYLLEPADTRTPEAVFEHRWALTLLARAQQRLADTYGEGGARRQERFEALRPLLTGGPTQPYARLAEELGVSETAVKVAVHRMRQRYRDALRAEIADTVGDPALVDDEITRLLAAVRAP
jgi:DNA-directed RNA polymerase specialized sigma24 family protein